MDILATVQPIYSFGVWMQQRRKTVDLTQRELAGRAGCTIATVKKIESDQRRPSRELALLLAKALQLPAAMQETFIECARGLRPVDALAGSTASPPRDFLASFPAVATGFFGREAELEQIAALLRDPGCRLLTLLGPGGVGKTRLAVESARQGATHFADGVAFVSLAAVSDATLIPLAIAGSLNLSLAGARPPGEQVTAYLRPKRLLLLLDNLEQLATTAVWLSTLRGEAPGVKLLVTSRERLNLLEEQLFPVQVLAPDAAADLFVASARRVQLHFTAAGQEAVVAHICRLVGELPLAIELAASWVRLLPLNQIVEQIRGDLDFLATHLHNVPERQRSLRAVFDHSWALLEPDEQETLAKLSVFRGGFTPEEAAAVAGATLFRLRMLLEKSLVEVSSSHGEGRYHLHELTRQYAAEKLQMSGEEGATRQQHLAVFVALAETADPQLHGPQAIAWFRWLGQEEDNFRAALEWGTSDGQMIAGDVPAANALCLRLANHLYHFWMRQGRWSEGERLLRLVVEAAPTGDSLEKCKALHHLGVFIALQNRYNEAAYFVVANKAMAERLEEPEALFFVFEVLSQALPAEQALGFFEDALAIWQQGGTNLSNQPWWLAQVHFLYGDRLREIGRYPEAAARYQKSLQIYRQIGNVDMIAYPLGNLGRLALHDGRLAEAHDLLEQSVAVSRAIGNRTGMADWLLWLGISYLYQGDIERAEAHLLETLSLVEGMGNRLGMAFTQASLAHVALIRDHQDEALDRLQVSLAAYEDIYRQMRQTEASPMGMRELISVEFMDSLLIAGQIATARQQFWQAAALFGLAEQLQAKSGHEPDPPLRNMVIEATAAVEAQLSPDEFEAAWAKGQSVSPERIIEVVQEWLMS